MVRKWYILLGIIFLSSIVSANGLSVNPDNITVNKTAGADLIVNFDLTNEEPFSFFNINFEDNPYIQMEEITELVSGDVISVEATIIADNNVNEAIRIKGFYEADIGDSNETYEIDVDFDDGISICDLTVIQGDTVIWHNLVSDEIVMRNADTQQDITTIPEGESHTIVFDNPLVLHYFFLRLGFVFTETCTINVLDDEGLVNDPNLDAILNLEVVLDFPPTTLASSVAINTFTMHFFEEREGIILLENTGSETAKNIHLEGDWFSFSPNNFDLNPTDTRIVSFFINPEIGSTNETNQNYIKNVSITGNFATLIEEFSIFINFANIGDGTGNETVEDLIDLICRIRPELCGGTTEIIYVGNGTQEFNISFTKEKVDGLFSLFFDLKDLLERNENNVAASTSLINTYTNSTDSRLGGIEARLKDQEENERKRTLYLSFSMVGLVFGIMAFFLIGLIFMHRKSNTRRISRTW